MIDKTEADYKAYFEFMEKMRMTYDKLKITKEDLQTTCKHEHKVIFNEMHEDKKTSRLCCLDCDKVLDEDFKGDRI